MRREADAGNLAEEVGEVQRMRYNGVQFLPQDMENDRSRPREITDPIAQLEKSDRRRRIMQMMFGTAVSGVLGYVTYPWVAGRRQGEFVDGMKSIWEQLRDNPVRRAPSEDTGVA